MDFSSIKVLKGNSSRNGSVILFDTLVGRDHMRGAFFGEAFDFEVRCIDGVLIKQLFGHVFGENYCEYQYKARTASHLVELPRYRSYLSAVTRHLKEKLQLKAFVNFKKASLAAIDIISYGN